MKRRDSDKELDRLANLLELREVPRVRLPVGRATSGFETQIILKAIASFETAVDQNLCFSRIPGIAPFTPLLKYSLDLDAKFTPRPSAGLNAMVQLVALGGKSIPFLLKSLSDSTKSHIEFPRLYGMEEGEIDWANPYNPFEKAALKQYVSSPGTDFLPPLHVVAVGELCHICLGQILARTYRPVDRAHMGSATINSPTLNEPLCALIRTMWGSANPEQMLLDSLLIDFSTRSRDARAGDSDGYYAASAFQFAAARRLVYYYPDIGIPLVVQRLDSLDLTEFAPPGKMPPPSISYQSLQRDMKNGVSAVGLINAVVWCRDGRIQAALQRIRRRSKDKDIIRASNGETSNFY